MCKAEGVTRLADVIDHIQPLALGGDDSDENCRSLCNPCHAKASAEQFGFRRKPRISVDGWPLEE